MSKSNKQMKRSSQNKKVASLTTQTVIRSGPLPTPEELFDYGKVDPSFPERIMKKFEEQATHRMELEKTVVKTQSFNSKFGVMSGSLIAIICIIGAIYLLMNDKRLEGLVALIVPLTTLAGVFIYGKSSTQKELRDKKDAR